MHPKLHQQPLISDTPNIIKLKCTQFQPTLLTSSIYSQHLHFSIIMLEFTQLKKLKRYKFVENNLFQINIKQLRIINIYLLK